eukprot:285058-Amphidinium_carterae.1
MSGSLLGATKVRLPCPVLDCHGKSLPTPAASPRRHLPPAGDLGLTPLSVCKLDPEWFWLCLISSSLVVTNHSSILRAILHPTSITTLSAKLEDKTQTL